MDKIVIKDAPFWCSTGIREEEREKKQEIIVDLELHTSVIRAAETDNIDDTIDYTEVYHHVRKEIEKKHYNLIETLAECVAQRIISNFNVSRVSVRIKKPAALSREKVAYTAVEVTREK
jgi:dihydroneopterin aldolase